MKHFDSVLKMFLLSDLHGYYVANVFQERQKRLQLSTGCINCI